MVRALELQPDSMSAMNLGTVYFYQGKMDEAGEAYLWAYDLDPEDPLPQANLGEYYEEIGDVDAAREWYLKALDTYDSRFQAQPPTAEELSDRAFYAAKAGRTDEA